MEIFADACCLSCTSRETRRKVVLAWGLTSPVTNEPALSNVGASHAMPCRTIPIWKLLAAFGQVDNLTLKVLRLAVSLLITLPHRVVYR